MRTEPISRLFRIQADAHRDTILDGIGAQLRGGRWNAKGQPMVYLATTPELCFLEYMVHLEGTALADLPPLILCEVAIPDGSILFLEADQLPKGWDSPLTTPVGLPQFMAEQFRLSQQLCIAIPSAIVPLSPSRNVVLDPAHALRRECRVISIQPYPIDPRLPTASRTQYNV